VSAALRRSFDSLAVPNYRRYFAGQLVSLSGNWMQTVAEIWLVLTLTGSGLAVGATTALQFLPMLALGAWGGVLADRFAKRRLLIATQALMALPALALFAISLAGIVELWMVYLLVFARGTVNAVDNPTRQSFVIEMVGPGRLVNAVSLNSVLVHAARMVGPALAALLIATAGVSACFALNAASFLAMIAALRGMDSSALTPAPRARREAGAIRAAIRHVLGNPELGGPLGLMAVVGTFGLNFQVILPLLARFSFAGEADAYALLVIAMALGAVAGALLSGARARTGPRLISASAFAFGIFSLLAAAAPTLAIEALVLIPLGAAAVTFAAAVNSQLQLTVAPSMRGRVMALYSVVFLGSTPIGGLLAGALSQAFDPRAALLLAASAGLSAAWAGHRILTGALPVVPSLVGEEKSDQRGGQDGSQNADSSRGSEPARLGRAGGGALRGSRGDRDLPPVARLRGR
jgi:MFS family permease